MVTLHKFSHLTSLVTLITLVELTNTRLDHLGSTVISQTTQAFILSNLVLILFFLFFTILGMFLLGLHLLQLFERTNREGLEGRNQGIHLALAFGVFKQLDHTFTEFSKILLN